MRREGGSEGGDGRQSGMSMSWRRGIAQRRLASTNDTLAWRIRLWNSKKDSQLLWYYTMGYDAPDIELFGPALMMYFPPAPILKGFPQHAGWEQIRGITMDMEIDPLECPGGS